MNQGDETPQSNRRIKRGRDRSTLRGHRRHDEALLTGVQGHGPKRGCPTGTEYLTKPGWTPGKMAHPNAGRITRDG